MEEKQEVVVVVIKRLFTISFLFLFFGASAQTESDSTQIFKKRVLETIELDFLMSFYSQDGNNAAVTGGIGTEELTDITPTIIISIPLNDDDILTIDAGVSAYTSASSSNVDALDTETPDPFKASSGASGGDTWSNINLSYSHSSDDRNKIWSGKISLASEYDYFSLGFSGSHTWLFNKKNTELGINGSVYLDTWNALYPSELRPFASGHQGSISSIDNRIITGNTNYAPTISKFDSETRNSYAAGISFSQILSKRMQGVIMADFVKQKGLLSTPFQRVYFADVANSYIGDFHLADGIEILPDNRFKIAVGTRVNYYLNEQFVLRNYYRYYSDDWGLVSHTYQLEIPIKIKDMFTLYPSYRFYNQSKSDYFAPYETHLSSEEFYTSDYDLSEYNANQFGLGINYTDIFTKAHIRNYGLKSVDFKLSYYERNTGLNALLVAASVKFVLDK
jgi:hypothetical protein